jgi:hypothetical protein
MSLQTIPNLAAYQRLVILTGPLNRLIKSLNDQFRASSDDEAAKARKEHGSRLASGLKLMKTKLRQVLRAGGEAFVILAPSAYFHGDTYSGLVDWTDWHPIPVSLRHEPWDNVKLKSDTFEGYFSLVKRWDYVIGTQYNPDDLADLIAGELPPIPNPQLVMTSIAQDWQGFEIACSLRFALHRRDTEQQYAEVYEPEPYVLSGPLHLLPPPAESSEGDAIARILVDFCGLEPSTPDPDWLATVKIPGEESAVAALQVARECVAAARSNLENAESALSEVTRFKRVLTEKGLPLQNLIRAMFEQIGFTTHDSPISDEFIIGRGDEMILVEVTGSDGSISTRDLSQLIKDLGKYLEATGVSAKGLLAVNPWRVLRPEERDTKDKPLFPDDVKKTARTFSVALLSSIQLFRAFCRIESGELSSEEFFNTLLTTVGPVQVEE